MKTDMPSEYRGRQVAIPLVRSLACSLSALFGGCKIEIPGRASVREQKQGSEMANRF